MQGDPLIERVIGRAVRLNGLLIPAEGVDTALARYVQQLCVHFDVKEWPFSLAGSTTLIAYRSRFFAVCCRHQLKGHDLQKACLIVNGGADVITSGGHSMFPEANATDFHDLMPFDFTEPCAAGALNPSLFFRFSQLPPDHLVEDVVCIVCAGYPTSDSSATFYTFKAKYGGMDVSDARRLKTLEDENARLKNLLAEQLLDNAILKDVDDDMRECLAPIADLVLGPARDPRTG